MQVVCEAAWPLDKASHSAATRLWCANRALGDEARLMSRVSGTAYPPERDPEAAQTVICVFRATHPSALFRSCSTFRRRD